MSIDSLLKLIGLFSIAMLGALFYQQIGLKAGYVSLVFAMSLAFVGSGNRVLWAIIFPFIVAGVGGLSQLCLLILPDTEFAKMTFMCVLISIVPGGMLWLAVAIGRSKDARLKKITNRA